MKRLAPRGKSVTSSGVSSRSASRSMTFTSANAPGTSTPRSGIPNSSAPPRQLPHRLGEAEPPLVPGPVAEHVGGLPCVHRQPYVGAGVAEADDHVRVGDHLGDGV